MEGFWTLQFTGVQGWGTGTVTLANGLVSGGDSAFTYTGTYTQQGSTPNVMGRDEFDLDLTGTKQGNTIAATGVIPGTQFRLNGTLTKQG